MFDYIETLFNPKRRHGFSNQLSPVEFEKRYAMSLQMTRQSGAIQTAVRVTVTLQFAQVLNPMDSSVLEPEVGFAAAF